MMAMMRSAFILVGCSGFASSRPHHSIRGSSASHRLSTASADAETGLDITEDVAFWTRMMQIGSLPLTNRPTRRPTKSTTFPTPTQDTPEPSPSPSLITPQPSPASSVTTPEPSPASSVATPEPSPAPSPTAPEPSPAPILVTPAPSPSPVFLTPEPSPAPSPKPSLTSTPPPTPAPLAAEPTPAPILVTPVPSPSPTLLTPAPSLPCNLTSEDRAFQLRQLYAAFSEDALFDDPTTPQAQALNWITNEDTVFICPDDTGCQPLQRYTLAAFYFATNGGSWDQCNAPADLSDPEAVAAANLSCERVVTPFGVPNDRVGDTSSDAWLTPVNECEWGGIACWGADTPNLNLCIDQLDFEGDGLGGTLVNELGALNSLRFLILEQGDIGGTIPTTYGLFERLLIFDMDFNSLGGSLPEEIYDLGSLQQLDVNDNLLTGTIPTGIGQLSLLTFLQIDHNLISGTIPSELGALDELRIAFLSDNNLVGTMPEEVCANRNTTTPPGNLGVLVTDCAGNPPEVVCTCCSSCA